VADDERELCVQYAPRIRAFGLRHLRDASDADDLVQKREKRDPRGSRFASRTDQLST